MPAQRKWEQKIEILIFEPKIWITLFNVWVRHSFNWTVFFQSFPSIVDVVFANEVVRVCFFVLNALYLDGCVEQTVLAAAQICDCSQSLKWLLGLNVDSHWKLALRDRPQVHVVQVNNVSFVLFPDVLFEILGIDVFRGAFHHNHNAIFECGVGRCEDHNSEAVSAKWVEPP